MGVDVIDTHEVFELSSFTSVINLCEARREKAHDTAPRLEAQIRLCRTLEPDNVKRSLFSSRLVLLRLVLMGPLNDPTIQHYYYYYYQY